MIKNFTIIFFMLITISVFGQDMREYQKETKALINSRKYPEALERCLWFHNHALEKAPSMSGVRLSFALSDWKKLGDVYPPALKAMMDVRDKKTTQVIEGDKETSNLFKDVVALNRTLGVPKKSVILFETILKTNPTLAKRSWYLIKNTLFDEKRYDLIKDFIGNPLSEYSVVFENYKRDTTMFSKMKVSQAQLKSFAENKFVESSLQLIDFSFAMKDNDSAKEIQQKAMSVITDYRLRDALSIKK